MNSLSILRVFDKTFIKNNTIFEKKNEYDLIICNLLNKTGSVRVLITVGIIVANEYKSIHFENLK